MPRFIFFTRRFAIGTQSIVGVDVGGTFTDLVYFDGGEVRIFKLLSTRADPSVALLEGLDVLAVAPDAVVSHGTTVATNALLEHKGARTALVTTAGFRDVLAIGRQTRPSLYRLSFPPRWLPVPDELRFEVDERVTSAGEVLVPLDGRQIGSVLDQALAAGAESLAVCLLFSFLHPAHEATIKATAEARGLNVSLSSEILPEYREFERTSTTVLNAYVSPLMAAYLTALEEGLARRSSPPPALPSAIGHQPSAIGHQPSAIGHQPSAIGHQPSAIGHQPSAIGHQPSAISHQPSAIGHQPSAIGHQLSAIGHQPSAIGHQPSALSSHLWIMQSSGGILSADTARREAVRTLLSGPAAGVAGAFHVASVAGHDHVITFDMGGTSTDVSLADGAIRRTSEGTVEGWPVRVPMLDVHTVGAGGGSIAWVDAGGALRVGPGSAGSEPGPACYGQGGMAFTVTDANLLLGRLDPAHFLGGRMALDRRAAEDAAAPVAARLEISAVELAEGIIRVANARMEQAIRVISVERGFDPRAFALLPFGGAGPMHALDLAEALHIGRVLIPRYPGVLSALGLVLADFTVDHSRTVMRPLDGIGAGDLTAAFEPLLAQGRAELAAEGFAGEAVVLEQALDLRYRGQSFELTIPVAGYDPADAARRFHAAHETRYGYARPDAAVELVNVRVTARGLRPKPELSQEAPAASPDPRPAQVGETRLRAGERWHATPVYERALLRSGYVIADAALVVQEDATTVITPGWRARVDAWANLVCEGGSF